MRNTSGFIVSLVKTASFTRLVFVALGGILSVCCTPAQKSVNSSPADPLIAEGRKLVRDKTCTTCHSLDGQPGVGPTFMYLYGKEETLTDGTKVVADEAYLRESITNPNAKVVARYAPSMPVMPLTPAELDSIIALIKSLKKP